VARHIEAAIAQIPEDRPGLNQPEEHHGKCRGLEVVADPALALALAHDLRHSAQIGADDLKHPGLALRPLGVEVLGEEKLWNHLVLADRAHVTKQRVSQGLQRAPAIGPRRAEIRLEAMVDQVQRGIQERVLAAEVAIDGGGHQADPTRDRGDAETAQSATRDDTQCRLGDLLAPDGAFESFGAHRLSASEGSFT